MSERIKAIKGSESGGGAAVNASRQLEDAHSHFLVLWENLKRSCCERAGEGTRGSVRKENMCRRRQLLRAQLYESQLPFSLEAYYEKEPSLNGHKSNGNSRFFGHTRGLGSRKYLCGFKRE